MQLCGQDQAKRWLNHKYIRSVGNNVCVKLFPNLFRKHKECIGGNERTFIIFLDCDIEDQLQLKSYPLHSFARHVCVIRVDRCS